MSRVRVTKTILSVVGFAASAGVPPPVLLAAAKLDPTLIAGPDADLLHSQELRLWDEAVQRLGPAQVRTGERVVAARETANGAVAEILHADGTRSERACDILVGADGIHSALRQQFYPDEGAPRWNGMMMWRGTTLARPFLDGRTMVQAGHRRAKFVVYPIEPVRPDGLQRINWICDRRLREDGFGGGLTAPSREDWSKPGSLDDLLRYASNRERTHVPAWRRWVKEWGLSGALGVWHETYVIEPGQHETLYKQMPPFGLGKVGPLVPAEGPLHGARGRLAEGSKIRG